MWSMNAGQTPSEAPRVGEPASRRGARRTVLVTGASSGIGRAAAETLKARGWDVFATARSDADLERLQTELGVTPVHLELADPASIAACARSVLEATDGLLYGLFNNAAYGQPGAVEDLAAEHLRRQLEVNVVGTHDLTRAIIPAMRRAGRGRIVSCSSVLGFIAGPYRGAYCASKFALEGLTDAMRLELAGTGIKVSLIQPGPIRTRFIETSLEMAERNIDIETSPHRSRYRAILASMRAGGKQRFKLEPEAVVEKLVHALESDRPRIRYRVCTPTHAAAILKRVLPDRALDWLTARQ